jgi:hypothetical protein
MRSVELAKLFSSKNTMHPHIAYDAACAGRVDLERVIEPFNSELRSKTDATRQKQEFESSRMTCHSWTYFR